MSPVSRGRKNSKKPKGKRSFGGGLDAPTVTPDYSQVERTVFGSESPAEVKLLAALSDAWQQLVQGMPANHCIFAVCAIQSVLEDWGVESEPVTVTALVRWTSLEVELGEERPSWHSEREWSGHLGLWIPGLGRFLDPTLYQANRPQAPTQITRGVILPVPPEQLGIYAFPKDGAMVQYGLVDDPGPSWRTGMPARGQAELAKNSAAYRSFMTRVLDTPEVIAVRRGLTHAALAAALQPASP